jgi:hypothetical protein
MFFSTLLDEVCADASKLNNSKTEVRQSFMISNFNNLKIRPLIFKNVALKRSFQL